MSSQGSSTALLMWAQRIVSKRSAPPHELLDLRPTATVEEAQAAFHKLARVAHPDLHRNSLSADDLEVLNAAYAIVAGAYQAFRAQATETTRMRAVPKDAATTGVAEPVAPTAGPASASSVLVLPATNAAQQMNGKAIVYYRKAELALKRGDLRSAMLQIKLAIAADANSAFLRSALAEVELAVKKG